MLVKFISFRYRFAHYAGTYLVLLILLDLNLFSTFHRMFLASILSGNEVLPLETVTNMMMPGSLENMEVCLAPAVLIHFLIKYAQMTTEPLPTIMEDREIII